MIFKKKNLSFARSVRLIIMAFVAYSLWQISGDIIKKDNNTAENRQISQSAPQECNKSKIEFPFMSIPLLPIYSPSVHFDENKIGQGQPAICGQTAEIDYELIIGDSEVPEKASKTFNIGNHDLMHGLELGVIGMKVGGERIAKISAELADTVRIPNDAKNKTVLAKINLKNLTPQIPTSPLDLRFIHGKIGSGKRLKCGDQVSANLTIWKIDGTKIFESTDKPLSFTLGKSQVAYGIESAILGMLQGGTSTLILPPAYNKSLIIKEDNTDIIPPLPQEILVVDIELK